ncbi:MAG: glutamate--cysteine ligase [Bradymonadaceae bacterium]
MSRDQALNVVPIENHDQLLDYFRSGEKPRHERGIGTEHEKFAFKRADGEMLAFEEPGGFGDLFQRLLEAYGWEAAYDGGHIVALEREGAAITLEPGGQFELSGAIFKTVFETAAEFDTHIDQIKAVAGDELAMAIWGMNPFYAPEEIPWMPKSRYRIMRKYLPTRGDHALYMMKTTCTIQANFDYTSEADAADIMRTAVLISPIISALFANSPVKENELLDYQSYRGYAWTRTDPDRTGVPPFMYRDDWGYSDYLEYILDVPMFFIRREQGYIDLAGHSFRDFLANGYEGHRASMGDFELHLSTAFPEIRLKKYIEVRGADGGPRRAVLALPALWKGILYHEPTRRQAAQLFAGTTPEAHTQIFLDAYRQGIHAHTTHGPMLDLATELIRLSREGLAALATEAGHQNEAVFLEPLDQIVGERRSFADQLAGDFKTYGHDKLALVARWEI